MTRTILIGRIQFVHHYDEKMSKMQELEVPAACWYPFLRNASEARIDIMPYVETDTLEEETTVFSVRS
jgi:hypothetical protein